MRVIVTPLEERTTGVQQDADSAAAKRDVRSSEPAGGDIAGIGSVALHQLCGCTAVVSLGTVVASPCDRGE